MNTYLVGTLWLVGVSITTLAVVVVLRRWRRDSRPLVDISVLSAVFSLAGMLFAIVAAFVFIDVWSKAAEARDATYSEAQAVQLVAWSANGMPAPERAEMLGLTRDYLREVVEQEWPRQAAMGVDENAQGWRLVQRMHEVAARNVEQAEDAPAAVESLLQARQERLAQADARIGEATWFALLVGAVLAALPIFFFPFDRALPQLALTATVASMITLLLFTIQQIERPFAHGRVPATAYEETLTRISRP
ncbi:bestrophin-like domain [Phytohabitans aurantiacus]|uniref:DUF4239 domain-containing protein n=1 Tax=Phytohabitans aurantiacus TaxID=3016789 RepID=A0ABQ5QSW4_9ACTN|nr:DUF4239 domain-containing protein [Phytohabitans aurantiacus]GLH96375.1 hypothetical protein Pa4123_16490 [Phytohabitans aurantiacus]